MTLPFDDTACGKEVAAEGCAGCPGTHSPSMHRDAGQLVSYMVMRLKNQPFRAEIIGTLMNAKYFVAV